MKKLTLILAFLVASCAGHLKDDPLIVPPNFADVPDVNNPEKPADNQKDANIEKLKDLLLKSE